MNKYKINIIFNDKENINDVLIKLIKREVKKNINNICNNCNRELTYKYTYISLQNKEERNV